MEISSKVNVGVCAIARSPGADSETLILVKRNEDSLYPGRPFPTFKVINSTAQKDINDQSIFENRNIFLEDEWITEVLTDFDEDQANLYFESIR